MNRISKYRVHTIFLTLVAFSLFTAQTHAQNESEKTFKAKCVACHAADGSGSEVGKKLGTHDFHSGQVRSESDADLAQIIGKGKNKMPAYEKSLKPDEIKALVAYMRELEKK